MFGRYVHKSARKKMTEAIEKQQVDAAVIAVAEADFDKYKGNVDVVLLAPQVRF